MEVWDGEEFIVWFKNIGKFGVPYKMGMGLSLAGSIYFGSPRKWDWVWAGLDWSVLGPLDDPQWNQSEFSPAQTYL